MASAYADRDLIHQMLARLPNGMTASLIEPEWNLVAEQLGVSLLIARSARAVFIRGIMAACDILNIRNHLTELPDAMREDVNRLMLEILTAGDENQSKASN